MSETWQEHYARTGKRFNKGTHISGSGTKGCYYWIERGESCMSDGTCYCTEDGRINNLRRLYGYYVK